MLALVGVEGDEHLVLDPVDDLDGLLAVLSRLGLAAALLGAGVHVVFFSIDGYALKHAADTWANAPAAQRPDLLQAGDLVLLLQNSQFVSAVAFLLGLPFLLLGSAVVRSDTYPAWLGWVAALAGTGSLFTGTTRFVGLDLVPDPVLFPAFALPASLALATLGVRVWRSTRTAATEARR